MKLGCCGTIDQAAEMKAAGFTYVEIHVQNVLKGEISSAEWEKTRPDPSKFVLPTPAANCLVPGSLPVVGPNRDLAKLQDYIQHVARRAQLLGLRTLVFGSGGARKCPPDLGLGKAMDQLVEFTHMAGEVCSHHGVTIVIEHLNQSETNTINKLSQELELIKRANHPNVLALVDSYHYGLEKETDLALLSLEGVLAHVHVAEPIDRIQPGGHGQASGKAYDFVHFFRLLRRIGYDGLISFEGKWTQPMNQVGPATVAYLQECWDKAGK